MRYIIYQIFLYTILCVCMCSCDPWTTYNYIITNKSSQDLSIILYPEENPYPENLFGNGGVAYEPNPNHLYEVRYLGNESVLIDYPITLLNLRSGISIQFSEYDDNHLFVSKKPEKGGSAPLWMQNNCINKILIKDEDNSFKGEISVEYWSNPRNWIMQNKKYDSIEYWLIIDDEVIREYGIADHQDH
ncbi:MAG: hypothetical protein HDS89_05655 [Bacteroidales bacterium]|nr:hypothetical protein [Bacteroidales bacterium]